MTTICFRSGVIAMDSRITADGLLAGQAVKGRMTKDYLIAAAGDLDEVQAFLDWAEKGFKEEDKKKYGLNDRECKVEGIVVDRKGNVLLFENRLYPYPLDAPFYTLGSGGQIALGALEMGASAYRAVKVASIHDTHTGGSIRLLAFKKKKVKKNAITPTK